MCMPHPAASHEYIRGPQALALRPHGHPGPAARGFELVGERMADNTKCSKTLDPCLLHRRPDDQERHVHGFLLTMLAQHAGWMYGCTGASRTKTRWGDRGEDMHPCIHASMHPCIPADGEMGRGARASSRGGCLGQGEVGRGHQLFKGRGHRPPPQEAMLQRGEDRRYRERER